ncbi:hypothetical protein MHB42_09700 [Lysinibacillus sp. FSL K6-0232]|uniref:hypothetical protein n=1 Tax=unclassified Lysinibacillus TaxID=2636778 RepID=UPI0030FBE592
MKRTILVLSLATLFAGCTAEPVVPVTTPTVEDKTPAQQEQGALRSFFPPDGSTAYFQGEGNEFAGYTLRTTFLDAEHIAQLEDNGGVVLLKIYRITNTTIDLVFQEPVDSEPALPSAAEAAAYPVLETILQQPLQVGTSFQGWTIESTNATVDTGTTVYHDVIQLTRLEDGMTTTKFFVAGIGLIRTEHTMQTAEDEPFVVTSTLQKIE